MNIFRIIFDCFSIGAGIGYSYHQKYKFSALPIYVSTHYFFLDRKFSPFCFQINGWQDIVSMLLLDICPLVAAKVRFATQKAKKVHHSMHYFFRMVFNDVSNRRKNKGTVGSGRIEIHKKILIFGNVIQKITIRFGITFPFIIFASRYRV